MIGYKSNVLLPDELLEQKATISEDAFLINVQEYLIKYPDYELVEVKDFFAVCKRKDDWNG